MSCSTDPGTGSIARFEAGNWLTCLVLIGLQSDPVDSFGPALARLATGSGIPPATSCVEAAGSRTFRWSLSYECPFYLRLTLARARRAVVRYSAARENRLRARQSRMVA